MKHYYLYGKYYLEFNEETNEIETKYKHLSKEMTRGQFARVVIKEILITFLICSLLTMAFYCGCVGGNLPIFVFCVSSLIFFLPGALICFGRLLDYNYYVQDCEEYLIDKLFSEEIKELNWKNIQETLKAEKWRATHTLEEKCRLALTKNPNYVADLIRYAKENVK